MQSRQLVLVRHAKAETGDGPDIERALAARGLGDAPGIGERLAREGLAPDRVVVSPARRAAQTWELAAGRLDSPAPVVDERVYRNTVADLLAVVRETPADAGTVVLVGHNPGLEQFAAALDDQTADPKLRGELARGLRTAGVAVFRLGTAWAQADAGTATLVAVSSPGSA